MRNEKKKIILIMSIMSVFLLTQIGCGGKKTKTETPSGSQPATQTEQSTPAEESTPPEKSTPPTPPPPPPKVPGASLGEISVKGKITLTVDEIKNALTEKISSIKECYKKEVEASPDLAGNVTLSITIDAKGKVTKATVKETTIKNKNVEDCVTEAVKNLTFPAGKKGAKTDATIPISFSMVEGEG